MREIRPLTLTMRPYPYGCSTSAVRTVAAAFDLLVLAHERGKSVAFQQRHVAG